LLAFWPLSALFREVPEKELNLSAEFVFIGKKNIDRFFFLHVSNILESPWQRIKNRIEVQNIQRLPNC